MTLPGQMTTNSVAYSSSCGLPEALATDLDGTLIPLAGNSENIQHLAQIRDLIAERDMSLLFVTGRHFESVMRAIHEFCLPTPNWILCDVGTSAYQRRITGDFELVDRYSRIVKAQLQNTDAEMLRQLTSEIPQLRLQSAENQTVFKVSFHTQAADLDDVVSRIAMQLRNADANCQIISSVDPVTGGGLIDLLPTGVSKAFALDWWRREHQSRQHSIIFAGDSGNDIEALSAGYRSIIVGNAAPIVVEQAREAHASAGWKNRLYFAKSHATSGVLEGLQHFRKTSG